MPKTGTLTVLSLLCFVFLKRIGKLRPRLFSTTCVSKIKNFLNLFVQMTMQPRKQSKEILGSALIKYIILGLVFFVKKITLTFFLPSWEWKHIIEQVNPFIYLEYKSCYWQKLHCVHLRLHCTQITPTCKLLVSVL